MISRPYKIYFCLQDYISIFAKKSLLACFLQFMSNKCPQILTTGGNMCTPFSGEYSYFQCAISNSCQFSFFCDLSITCCASKHQPTTQCKYRLNIHIHFLQLFYQIIQIIKKLIALIEIGYKMTE
ncbi:unnamed protein product [Meganyctiphanes norvegica]|uniref:WAP domain-containing protein n=1 Tax=Meganyctiphanes norvegica TaxID=48144 RepID=A0AAV2RBD3_MEGNR